MSSGLSRGELKCVVWVGWGGAKVCVCVGQDGVRACDVGWAW